MEWPRRSAKRLTEKTLFTQIGLMIGTPAYMSPEQAGLTALDVDTTTHVYSLGVVLYELLVGALPLDLSDLWRAGYEAICRVIREVEPPKPSTKLESLGATGTEVAERRHTDVRTLARQVRGDLEWITMKALEKDRTRRYASASEFAVDIGRYLNDEPVAAGPPDRRYRMRKFVRRYRRHVATAVAALSCLLAGLAVSTVLFFRAESARRESDRLGAIGFPGRRIGHRGPYGLLHTIGRISTAPVGNTVEIPPRFGPGALL